MVVTKAMMTITRLDLLNDSSMWIWAGIVLAAAVFGKMGGAVIAARWTGQSWRNALALGALLNTRGLVELIVLSRAEPCRVTRGKSKIRAAACDWIVGSEPPHVCGRKSAL
jgi:Kef-type K+ transport system membrane component KefB